MIARLAPELLVVSMNYFERNPLIMTELLARVLMNSGSFDLNALLYDRALQLVFDCALLLQKMVPCRRVFRCRSVLFAFLSELALEHGFFRSVYFASHFLWFMFEGSLTGFILGILTEWLSKVESGNLLSAVANYIHDVFLSCLSNSYFDLTGKLLAAVVNGLRGNWVCSSCFARDFPILLDIARIGSRLSIVCDALKLFVMLSFERSFSLSMTITRAVYGCISEVAGSDPSSEIEDLLFALLASSFAYQELLMIRIPSAIPIILSAFGRSPKLPSVLQRFSYLIKSSDYNRRMAHDGYFDLILAKSLNSEVVQLSPDFSFGFKAPRAVCEDLLQYISELKSNEAVSSVLVEGIDNEAKVNFLMNILAKERNNRLEPQFPIG
jgi:hypothetical protein